VKALRAGVALLFLPWLLAQQVPDPARLDADRITSAEFVPQRFGPARWLDGAHYATIEPKPGSEVFELVRYEAASGNRSVLVSAAMLWVAAAGKALAIENYDFAPDGKRLLVFTQSERARAWSGTRRATN